MWILTIVLLFASGESRAYAFEAGAWKAEYQAAADDMRKLNDMGLHVIGITCEQVKEA